jgi:TolA-binding protein
MDREPRRWALFSDTEVLMRRSFSFFVAMVVTALPAAALAQSAVEGRVDRLEREMRAVQRKVFPGGSGQMVTPDIVAPETQRTAPGVPATSALADLTARVSALESQIATMTGQIEQSQFRMREAEQAFEAYRKTTDARLSALEGAGIAATAATVSPTVSASGDTRPNATPAAAASRDPARADAVAAVQRPSTGDAAEDSYTYGLSLIHI